MRLGLIGRGYWGNVYAKTLTKMGVEFWQAGRNWREMPKPDAAIVACSANAHYKTAKQLISQSVPVLIEKPVCLSAYDAEKLLKFAKFKGGIVFVGHTRLYSPEWQKFKMQASIQSIRFFAGGKSKLGWSLDWLPHLMAMCLDIGVHPSAATFKEKNGRLGVIVNETLEFKDELTDPTPLECLLTEFMSCVKLGLPDVRGLSLGVRVMQEIERMTMGEAYGT